MRNLEAEYTREYLELIEELGGDEAGRRAAWERMGQGTSFWDGQPSPLSYIPRIFSAQTRERFRQTAELTYGLLAAVIERYRGDEAFRREFRFDPRVEELVMLPRGIREPLPYARVDFSYDEDAGTLRAIEFNTDTSSGMNENREALAAVRVTQPYARFAERHELSDDVEQQFEGWVQRFAALRAESPVVAKTQAAPNGGAGDGAECEEAAHPQAAREEAARPHMALVACLDSPDPDIGELETYRALFERAGIPCSVFDVREFEFDGQRLMGRRALSGASNVQVDCVWRWCIVVDLLEHWDDVQPFLNAVRAGAVELIGSFATQIAHDKQLFAVLHRPQVKAWLSPDEQAFVDACIPFTAFLDDESLDLEAVKREPARWVVKPTDWYESKRVVAGRDCTPEEWARTIDEYAAQEGGSPFIVQEFCEPYATPAIPLRGQEGDFTAEPVEYGNIVGLYLQAGKYAGAYVRQGPHAVIGSARDGLVTPVVFRAG